MPASSSSTIITANSTAEEELSLPTKPPFLTEQGRESDNMFVPSPTTIRNHKENATSPPCTSQDNDKAADDDEEENESSSSSSFTAADYVIHLVNEDDLRYRRVCAPVHCPFVPHLFDNSIPISHSTAGSICDGLCPTGPGTILRTRRCCQIHRRDRLGLLLKEQSIFHYQQRHQQHLHQSNHTGNHLSLHRPLS